MSFTVEWVDDHRSGRFDADAGRLQQAIAMSLRTASIVALTETSSMPRGKVVRGFSDQCWVVRGSDGPRGDTALLVDRGIWQMVWSDVVDLVVGVPDRPRSRIAAPIAVLRHRGTGAVVVRSAAHLPAGVEAGYRARIATARAHVTAVRTWRHLVERAAATYDADAVVVTADWNLDLRKRWVRATLRALWPDLRPGKLGTEDRGTHGSRIIDFPATKPLKSSVGQTATHSWFTIMSGDPATSDHRPIRCHITLRPAGRRRQARPSRVKEKS